MDRSSRLLLGLGSLATATLVALLSSGAAAALLSAGFGLAAGVLLFRSAPEGRVPPPVAEPERPFAAPDPIEAIDDPVLVITKRTITGANSAARALLGQHIVGEDARVAIRHPDAASRLAGPPERVRGIALSGLGGRDSRWEMAITPLDADVRIAHLVDRSAAHAAETMRVDFVANASHELRTPLATLLGFIETLAAPDGPEDGATRGRFLDIMLREARRMRQLVDDLISLSRIEAERHRAPDRPVALGPLTFFVADAMRVAAGEPAATFAIDAAPDLPPVAGDEAQLSQLLNNVLGNALKYRRPGTPVTVAISLDEAGCVRLTVTDQGDGIAPEHLPRLTERFYRVDPGRSRSVGGTGLGLAIVKHVVERHRGRLDIASTVGSGTTVTVTLPAAVSRNSNENVIDLPRVGHTAAA